MHVKERNRFWGGDCTYHIYIYALLLFSIGDDVYTRLKFISWEISILSKNFSNIRRFLASQSKLKQQRNGFTMVNIENGASEAEPVFVPPRKRQSSKKPNGVQNYVDHIVCAQVS